MHLWTNAQTAAIQSKNKSLLISAAAGSGKTATLTERIVSSIVDSASDSDISRMLIVTYTKAAAAELKERISSALTEALETDPTNKKLIHQLLTLPSADISTIHSFALKIIRPNFQRFSLPPNFRVGDDAELKLIRQSIMNDILDLYYTESKAGSLYSGDFDFVRLADCLSDSAEDSKLPSLLIGLYEKLSAYPRSIKLLDDYANRLLDSMDCDFIQSPHGRVILNAFVRKLSRYFSVFSSAINEFSHDPNLKKSYQEGFEVSFLACKNLLDTAARIDCSIDLFKNSVREYDPPRLKSLKKEFQTERTDFYKKCRSDFAKFLKDFDERLFSVSAEKIAESEKATALICRDIGVVLADFERDYLDYKQLHGICDYNDLERYASQLLYNEDGSYSDIAAEFRARYDEIFIDEYQDTNALQDSIFSAISRRNNRFMVGDIKQSIYKFRGAEPSIFASYRTAFPEITDLSDDITHTHDSASIFMSNNFRCDETIIDFANIISRYMFLNSSGIPYNSGDDLIFSKTLPYDGYFPAPVQVFLLEKNSLTTNKSTGSGDNIVDEIGGSIGGNIDAATESDEQNDITDDDENSASDEGEANFVAAQIAHLIRHGRKADGSRILAGDIAILLRSPGASAEKFKRALDEKNISSLSCADNGFFEKPEVLLLLSLLCAIDNPTRDVYLASVMMSPLFQFSMDEMTVLRYSVSDTPLYYSVKEYSGLGDESSVIGEIHTADDTSGEPDSQNGTQHNKIFTHDHVLMEKCRRFIRTLELYRDRSRGLPTDKLIWYLLRDTGIIAILGGKSDGRNPGSIKRSLLMFYEYARRFESTSYKGLYNFIRYVIGIIDDNSRIDLSPDSAENSDESVTITSIHKSKGLEYPVCFLCGTAKKHNFDDLRKNLLFDFDLGVTVKIKDGRNGLVRYNTILRQASVQRASDSQIEEEMRTLYVALTRARERLIITAEMKNPAEFADSRKLESMFVSEESVYSANSYIDWITSALFHNHANGGNNNCCALNIITSKDNIAQNFVLNNRLETGDFLPLAAHRLNSVSNDTEITYDDETVKLLSERFAYKYPFSHLSAIPAKLTVSKLHDNVLDSGEDSSLESLKIDEDDMQSGQIFQEADKSPRFIKTDSSESRRRINQAAESGTATHIFMQFCDFDRTEQNGIESELNRLINESFISQADADLINKRQLEKFFKSDIYKKIKNAKVIHREFRFNIYLPASDFTANPSLSAELSGEEILVQGVIDCLFMDEEGNYVLLDYKTDRLTSAELSSPALSEKKLITRHKTQLEYYKKACEKMLSKKIAPAIYSLSLGECIWL